jgi:hypothetical protein
MARRAANAAARAKENIMSDSIFVVGDKGSNYVADPEDLQLRIGCSRCDGAPLDDCHCPSPGEWLEYRRLWITAERELEKHRRIKLDVDKAKADLEEFMDAAHKDAEQLNAKIETLQKALGNAISLLQTLDEANPHIASLLRVLASTQT